MVIFNIGFDTLFWVMCQIRANLTNVGKDKIFAQKGLLAKTKQKKKKNADRQNTTNVAGSNNQEK